MAPGSGSLSSLRELNRLRIVDFLRINGTASRAELARRTGLARSTVSTLVSDLQRRGIVVEQPGQFAGEGSRAGPPPSSSSTPRRARPSASTSTTTGCASRCRTCRASSWPRPVRASTSTTTPSARSTSPPTSSNSCWTRSTSAATGCSARAWRSPGPIDQERAALHNSTVLPGWADVDAGRGAGAAARHDRVRRQRREPGRAGGGHARRRAPRPLRRLRPDGLGRRRGIVVDGSPYRGARGTAGEIGHVVVDPQGPLCRCGNRGCLETVAFDRGAAGACEREPRA